MNKEAKSHTSNKLCFSFAHTKWSRLVNLAYVIISWISFTTYESQSPGIMSIFSTHSRTEQNHCKQSREVILSKQEPRSHTNGGADALIGQKWGLDEAGSTWLISTQFLSLNDWKFAGPAPSHLFLPQWSLCDLQTHDLNLLVPCLQTTSIIFPNTSHQRSKPAKISLPQHCANTIPSRWWCNAWMHKWIYLHYITKYRIIIIYKYRRKQQPIQHIYKHLTIVHYCTSLSRLLSDT